MEKTYWNLETTTEAVIVEENFLDQTVVLQTKNGTRFYMSFEQFKKEWKEKGNEE